MTTPPPTPTPTPAPPLPPTPPGGPQETRAILHELDGLIADRVRAENACRKEHRAAVTAAEREYEATREQVEARFVQEMNDTGLQHDDHTGRLKERFEDSRGGLKTALSARQQDLASSTEAEDYAAREGLKEKLWVAETLYEANEGKPRLEYELTKKELQARAAELTALETQAAWLLRKYRQPMDAPAPPAAASAPAPVPPEQMDPRQRFEASFAATVALLSRLHRMLLPRIFSYPGAAVFIVIFAAATEVLALWQEQWRRTQMTDLIGGAALGAFLLAAVAMMVHARRRVAAVRSPLLESIARAKSDLDQALAHAAQRRDAAAAALLERRVSDARAAREHFEPLIGAARRKREEGFREIQAEYGARRAAIDARHSADQAEADLRRRTRVAAAEERHAAELAQDARLRDDTVRASQGVHDAAWTRMESEWKRGMARVHAAVAALNRNDDALFPTWSDPAWDRWSPPRERAAGHVRFGNLRVDLRTIPGGVPEDTRLLVSGPTQFPLPADLALPDHCSLLLRSAADGAGRAQAITALQAVVLRLLTAFPPGKVRFVILDPVGLGQSFAGFMHLADYDEALVGGKIWTEARHIEQRLTDLTEHMENVIQKYLRNEFATIGEYNVQAGEIAEPYRFLVIADFPVNFSDASAKRLASIVASGARCGVHTLIAYDARQPLPQGVALSDIEAGSARLVWKKDAPTTPGPTTPGAADGAFIYDDPDFARWPLTLDQPPTDEAVSRIVHAVGAAAKDSSRVQVPFDVIAPAAGEFWSLKCDTELRVPLGRAGATKLQYLALGKGTSQHVLIAGKTGSGKSTLLHALITSLSLWYSPEEVELYLVDFKKGVEFKCYATHSLAHARAVAIESDREFGLSVLHRLDAELKRRGNMYRDLHVQDLAGYRAAVRAGKVPSGGGGAPAHLPRILLIIDEFQEFFVEDDKLAQDASLLLDRLVRQGRAFGVHVLLGSQTLSGAYTLARSTMGQMAVRIALQCSEADSYLILSEDNSAARLLARPGEAIYNDSAGLVEGNSPFQVVWLPEEVRERQLTHAADLARRHHIVHAERQAVFEGNVPADIARNYMLASLLTGAQKPAPQAPVRAWLGDAIAIKDPTAAVLRRQAAGNLLVVGQREEVSLAMLATSMVSLAAHDPQHASRLYIFDGAPPDDPHAGYLARLASALPHRVLVAGQREVAAAMDQLGGELARRQNDPHAPQDPVYLLIYGLHRFRSLKRPEDDFSFSPSDKDGAQRPDQHLATLLRDGPPLGMHTLVWCDTAGTLSRWLDRQALREFDSRVLLQMSAADSTALIDSPDAGKLGMHRALLFTEEQGGVEKFRPYALPTEHWLAGLVTEAGVQTPAAEPEVR
jgi:S-DNA-T family DNA segregation ATPase FtsK/SpoIIIE